MRTDVQTIHKTLFYNHFHPLELCTNFLPAKAQMSYLCIVNFKNNCTYEKDLFRLFVCNELHEQQPE